MRFFGSVSNIGSRCSCGGMRRLAMKSKKVLAPEFVFGYVGIISSVRVENWWLGAACG